MRLIDVDACESFFYEHLDDSRMAAAMNAINDMPTIEPERKKGKWILDNSRLRGNRYTCDQCGYETDSSWNPPGNFCPNCGADMRGEE